MSRMGKHIYYSNRPEFKPMLTQYFHIPGQRLQIAGIVHYPFDIVPCKCFHQPLRTTPGRVQQHLVDSLQADPV